MMTQELVCWQDQSRNFTREILRLLLVYGIQHMASWWSSYHKDIFRNKKFPLLLQIGKPLCHTISLGGSTLGSRSLGGSFWLISSIKIGANEHVKILFPIFTGKKLALHLKVRTLRSNA